MPEWHGRNFRAMTRLSTRDNRTLALRGETCERVPAASLPLLLESGKIAPVSTVTSIVTEADWRDLGRPGKD